MSNEVFLIEEVVKSDIERERVIREIDHNTILIYTKTDDIELDRAVCVSTKEGGSIFSVSYPKGPDFVLGMGVQGMIVKSIERVKEGEFPNETMFNAFLIKAEEKDDK